jgi:thioredoxin 1
VAAGLGIRSIPTVVVYKDGKPAATQVGAMNKNELTDWIQSLL